MEGWVEICRMRLKDAEYQLPPDDLDRLKEKYLARKRSKRLRRLLFVSVSSAAAVVILTLIPGRPSHHENPEREAFPPLVPERGTIVSERILDIPPADETSLVHSIPNQIASNTAPPVDDEQPAELSYAAIQPTSKDSCEVAVETPVKERESQVTVEDKTEDTLAVFMMESGESPSRVRVAFSPYLKGFKGVSQKSNSWTTGIGDNPGVHFAQSVHHSIPLTFGLDASVLLRSNLSLTTGLEFSGYHSEYVYHDKTKNLDLNAYYVGIPLRMDYFFWQTGPLSSWIGLGGKVDRLLYGQIGTERKTDPSFHWSITGDVGVQYELYPGIGLYFQPEISYYFKPSDAILYTSRIDNPLMLSLGVGLRFSID